MKRRINLYFITLLLASLLISSAVSLAWVGNRFQNSARESLDSYLKTTMQLTPDFPAQPDTFVDSLAASYSAHVRITLIDVSGRVLGDTQAELDSLEGHLARAEFAQAAETGYGEALRRSSTTGETTLYVARKWGEDHLLRFAMPVSVTRSFAQGMLPVLLADAVVMVVLTMLFVGKLSKGIMAPYEKMFSYLEQAIRGGKVGEFQAPYEEMEPVMRYFQELLGRIKGYIRQVRAKTQEVETILSNMEEGLVMLDGERNILLINKQGSRFLDIPDDPWQKNITFLYRDPQFHEALDQAVGENTRVMADIVSRAGDTHRFYINPVQGGGTVLLISDVTQLVQLEQVRSEFAANVSHELKTPLTAISGFAEMMQAGMVPNQDTMVEYAGKILTQSQRLMALINDILELSALENGVPLEIEPVDMAGAFHYAGEMLREQRKQGGVALTVAGKLTLAANRQKMEELALNLVDNAVKYNRPGGTVRVELLPDGFTVADTGIGIPPEHLDRIFERFYRVDKARSRKTGGTGLGLSIAKHIVELYGGHIGVKSSGQGAVFTVSFPPELIL